MILAIYLDQNRPHHLREVYAFSFSYLPEFVSSSVTISEQSDKIVTNDQCRFEQLISNAVSVTQKLGPLPERFYVTLKLHFDEAHMEPGFSLSGFRKASEIDHLYFAVDSGTVVACPIISYVGHKLTGF